MKVVAVCGMGIGTAVLLKMNAEKVLGGIDPDGVVEAAALGTVRRIATGADVLLVLANCADQLEDLPVPVIVIDDVLDLAEISSKLASFTRS